MVTAVLRLKTRSGAAPGKILSGENPGVGNEEVWAERMGAFSLAQEVHYLHGPQLFNLLNVVGSNHREKFTLLKSMQTFNFVETVSIIGLLSIIFVKRYCMFK